MLTPLTTRTGFVTSIGRPSGAPLAVMRTRWGLPALLSFWIGVFLPPNVHAQTLYEWRAADGSTVYSQSPPEPGQGTVSRTLQLQDLDGLERATMLRVAARSANAADPLPQALRGADTRINHAITALMSAERALRTGQSPKAGERQHLVNGHSRLKQVYFDRIKALESRVVQARAELQAAYAARDALKP